MLSRKGAQGPPCASIETKTLVENYSKLLDVVKFQEEVLKLQHNEIPQILDEWRSCVQRLDHERAQHKNLKQSHKLLEDDILDLHAEVTTLKVALRDAKEDSAATEKEISVLRHELERNRRRFQLIRENVQTAGFSEEGMAKLSSLAGPDTRVTASRNLPTNGSREADDDTVDDNDYDESVDSQDILGDYCRNARSARFSSHRNRRRSTSVQPQMTKRDRSAYMTDIFEENNDSRPSKRSRDDVKHQVLQGKKSDVRTNMRQSLNRSMSANDIIGHKATFGIEDMVAQNHLRGTSTADLRTPLRPVSTATWIRNGTIEKRNHSFAKLSTTFKVTYCAVCYGGIHLVGRAAQKCKDCHQHVHTHCKNRLGIPCIPRLENSLKTPSKSKTGAVLYKLQDFCPPASPMIAWPIIQCVAELEKRGLIQEGLYRVPGKKNTVTNVLNDLRTSRNMPKLDILDIEVIADVIKQFLRELRDPLIPKTSRDEFIKAAIADKMSALNTAIFDLPQANRDTLAYLILHWQRVAAESQMNKMPIENIARCVALAVMGQSSYGAGDMGTAARETGERERVLTLLLSIDAEYWQRYLFRSLQCSTTPTTIPSSSRCAQPESTKAATINRAPLDDSSKFHSTAEYSLLGAITPLKDPSLIIKPSRPGKFFPSPY